MRQLLSKLDVRYVSLILALVVLLAGLPLTSEFVLVSGPSHPEITVNICHPIQALDLVPVTLLARPAKNIPDQVLCDLGSTSASDVPPLTEFLAPPDTPPPKSII